MARTGGCRRCGRCRRRTDAGSRRQSLSLSGDAVIAGGPGGAAGPVLSLPGRLSRTGSPGPGHPPVPPGIPRVSAPVDWRDLHRRCTGHPALLGRLDLPGLPGFDGVPGLVADRLNDLGLPEHPLGCAGDPVRLSRSSRFSRSSRRLPDRPGIFRRSLSIRSMRNGLNRLQALIPGGPGRPRPLGRPGRLRLLGPLGGPGIRRARGEPRPGRAPGAPGTPRVP